MFAHDHGGSTTSACSSLRHSFVLSIVVFCLFGCRATANQSAVSASSGYLFADAAEYSDLIRELPSQPWLNTPNSSERYFPLFVGLSSREIVLGTSARPIPRLPADLKAKVESRISLLAKMTGEASFEVQAWPSLDENGQFEWVFARWRGKDAEWRWFTTADARRYRSKHDHGRGAAVVGGDPLFAYLLHPSHVDDEIEIFADFSERPGLYDQPLYGNCVFVDRKTQKVVKAWPDPYSVDRAKWRSELTKRGAYDAYCVNPPSFFNDRYLVFSFKVNQGRLQWSESVNWLKAPNEVTDPIQSPVLVRSWPASFTKDYERDIKIADGELEPRLPNGSALKPFKKKGSHQVGHDLERMVDYLELRYKELSIPTTRQRFQWRGLPQSNLIAVIEGQDPTLPPIVLADHIDSAIAEDVFESTGQRVTAPGANDNSTATSLLLQSAKVLRGVKPKRPIWLVHLTGEEFPAVDLGARHFLSEMMRDKKDIYGVIITDFIGSHQPDSLRFQISPTAVPGSERFAAMALDAAKDLAGGLIEAVYQPRNRLRNSVFQTDLLEFEFRGYPGILFNEDMDYSQPESNNPNYHQSTDIAANIDLEFSAQVAKIAIETALRMANDQ